MLSFFCPKRQNHLLGKNIKSLRVERGLRNSDVVCQLQLVWLKIAQFLGMLNGENINRESYVRTPEYVKALEAWKETEQEWEAFLETLSEGQREKAEEMKECLEDFASAQEKRAYIQGYADCVQVLFHMGLLKENEGLKWAEKMELS